MKPTGAGAGARTKGTGRRRSATALALGALMLLATACGGGGGGGDDANGDLKAPSTASSGSSASAGSAPAKGTADTKPSTAVVSIAPEDGADNVATTGALKVSATGGKLTAVTVKDDKGAQVPGEISADGLGWRPDGHLRTATQYTVDAVAKDSAGRESDKHASFTTVTPKDTFIGYFTPEDGSTVGVGMEVYLHFNRSITHKKDVEAGVTVTADPPVEVAARWNGSQDLYIRPADYWAAGTKVTLSLDLAGVEGASGVYGTQHKDVHFTVGRRQVSIVDAAKHTMTVYRDNKVIRTIPITAGAPGRTTYNGKMVISEKHLTTRMNGDTVGFGGEYDIPDVPHAMRLTNSGTFIHGNYWASNSTFGSSNTSHGCVSMHDARGAHDSSTPAAWFYDHSIIGDVVQVVHSEDKTVQWYNGLNGWNLSWSQWKA